MARWWSSCNPPPGQRTRRNGWSSPKKNWANMRTLQQNAPENFCVSCSPPVDSPPDTRTVPHVGHAAQPYPFSEAVNRGTHQRARILGSDQTTGGDERGSTTHRGNGVGGRQRRGSSLWPGYPFRGAGRDSAGGKAYREQVRLSLRVQSGGP